MEELIVGEGVLKCRVSEIEEKNERLEVEIKMLNEELELSASKIKKLEGEKDQLGVEVCKLRRRNEELEDRVKWFENGLGSGGKSEESARLCEVMVENKMLKCGKIMEEEEVKGLKEKIVELEARVAQLEDKRFDFDKGVDSRTRCGDMNAEAGDECVDLNLPIFHSFGLSKGERAPSTVRDGLSGIPNLNTPTPFTLYTRRGNTLCERESDSLDGLTTKRKLVYSHERSSSPTMASDLPARVNSSDVGIIDISNSDEDENITRKKLHFHAAVPDDDCPNDDEVSRSLKNPILESSSEEQFIISKESITPKRKRILNVMASDSESDDLPIALNKNIANQDQNSRSEDGVEFILTNATRPSIPQRRRRLVSLSQHYGATNGKGRSGAAEENPFKYGSEVHCTTENMSDNGKEDTESESEGDSLGGFIVKSSDSNSDDSCTNDCCSEGNSSTVESHLQSDCDIEYAEIMSKLRRDKDHKMKWELEGDMLAAFGKDSEICLKAVCALYRQQTSDEKQCKGTIHANGRGFNQLDALRGSELAEFLTDGDPLGPVKKSVDELEKYYPNGVEVCRDLAKRYSKQLFNIFQNNEDPLFHPTP